MSEAPVAAHAPVAEPTPAPAPAVAPAEAAVSLSACPSSHHLFLSNLAASVALFSRLFTFCVRLFHLRVSRRFVSKNVDNAQTLAAESGSLD